MTEKHVKTDTGQQRYHKPVGEVIGGGSGTAPTEGVTPEVPALGSSYAGAIQSVRAAVAGGAYDIGVKHLSETITELNKAGGNDVAVQVLKRTLSSLQQLVAGSRVSK